MISDYDLGEIIEDDEEYEPSNIVITKYSNGYIVMRYLQNKELYKIDPITGKRTLIEVEGKRVSPPLPEENNNLKWINRLI